MRRHPTGYHGALRPLAALGFTMTFAAPLVAVCAALFAATAHAAPAPPRKADRRVVLTWQSTLKDDDNKPVAGIFQLEFALLKGHSKKPFWREKHWVAVDNGHYALPLGRASPLPKDFDVKSAVMVVSMPGDGEVLREALGGDAALSTEPAAGAADRKRIATYAEKAGFAYEAERATTADRIGNYTASLLQEALDALQKRKLKVRVGKGQINLTTVGGAGGTPFESICPAGTVMIGLRGGSGVYIDNFQVVCAPLE